MRQKIYRIIEIGENDDRLGRCYDWFMLGCIICSVIPLCFRVEPKFFFWTDKITVTVFILDYILRWMTADIKFQQKKISSFIKYPFTPFAVLDLLSILPSLNLLRYNFQLFRLFRLFRAARVLRLVRYSKSFNLFVMVVKREREALQTVWALVCGYILLSALIMFQVEPDNFKNFFEAIYWAVVTLTTVGYGDIYPMSSIGRIVSMISSLAGVAIVALPTGIIAAGYMNILKKDE